MSTQCRQDHHVRMVAYGLDLDLVRNFLCYQQVSNLLSDSFHLTSLDKKKEGLRLFLHVESSSKSPSTSGNEPCEVKGVKHFSNVNSGAGAMLLVQRNVRHMPSFLRVPSGPCKHHTG